jgi:hypothetical protein
MSLLLRNVLLLMCMLYAQDVFAQEKSDTTMPPPMPVDRSVQETSSGFQVIPKLGLGVSRNFLADLGLIGYSYIPDKRKSQYFDANIGVRALIGRHSMLMPKLDIQAALFPLDPDELFCFNVGADAGLVTDFKRTSVMLVPKAGFSVAMGLVRIYYLHQFLLKDRELFPGYGRHGVMLEVNISTLQGKGFRTM